jgi:hypothetical protein
MPYVDWGSEALFLVIRWPSPGPLVCRCIVPTPLGRRRYKSGLYLWLLAAARAITVTHHRLVPSVLPSESTATRPISLSRTDGKRP